MKVLVAWRARCACGADATATLIYLVDDEETHRRPVCDVHRDMILDFIDRLTPDVGVRVLVAAAS